MAPISAAVEAPHVRAAAGLAKMCVQYAMWWDAIDEMDAIHLECRAQRATKERQGIRLDMRKCADM